MGEIVKLQANYFTHRRMREKREAAKRRLIQKIGIRSEDAPLFDEMLKMMAYEESLRR